MIVLGVRMISRQKQLAVMAIDAVRIAQRNRTDRFLIEHGLDRGYIKFQSTSPRTPPAKRFSRAITEQVQRHRPHQFVMLIEKKVLARGEISFAQAGLAELAACRKPLLRAQGIADP